MAPSTRRHSQLGGEAAAFHLGVGEGSWAFSMKDADTNETGHTFRAVSDPAMPDADTWVHLVGVHDAKPGRSGSTWTANP